MKRKVSPRKFHPKWKRRVFVLLLLGFCFASLVLLEAQYCRIKMFALLSPPSVRKPKIAFLFIARNRLPLVMVWDAFFQGDKENKFSIFVHSRPGFLFNKATTRSAYFLNRQVNDSIQSKVEKLVILLHRRAAASPWPPAGPLHISSFRTSPKSLVDLLYPVPQSLVDLRLCSEFTQQLGAVGHGGSDPILLQVSDLARAHTRPCNREHRSDLRPNQYRVLSRHRQYHVSSHPSPAYRLHSDSEPHPSKTPKQPAVPAMVRTLLSQASSVSIPKHSRLSALRRLRGLARDSEKNRSVISAHNAREVLLAIVFSNTDSDSCELNHEALAVLAMFLLSESECAFVSSDPERITYLVSLLFHSSIEVRVNSAALIEIVLAGTRSPEIRAQISNGDEIFEGIVGILNCPLAYPRALKVGIKALFALCLGRMLKNNKQR